MTGTKVLSPESWNTIKLPNKKKISSFPPLQEDKGPVRMRQPIKKGYIPVDTWHVPSSNVLQEIDFP